MAERSPVLPFDDEDERANRAVGLIVAVLLHVIAGVAIAMIKPIEKVKQVWVEVTMAPAEPEPEPPPPPELKPEPPPPEKKRPEVVDFKDTVEEATPDAPIDTAPADKPVRRIQGLSASSFAAGSGSGFSVRAGTTLRTQASEDTMDLDEAANSVAFSAVTRQPRVRSKPPLRVPDVVQELKLEGVVHVLVDVDATGTVTNVTVSQSLQPDADRACVKAWSAASFAPAMQGDHPVAVRNAPYRCRIEIAQ